MIEGLDCANTIIGELTLAKNTTLTLNPKQLNKR